MDIIYFENQMHACWEHLYDCKKDLKQFIWLTWSHDKNAKRTLPDPEDMRNNLNLNAATEHNHSYYASATLTKSKWKW